MDFDDVARLGSALPEVEVSQWYGTPGLKVRGKGFCRLWGEDAHHRNDVLDTEVLVVLCELEEKDALIESFAGALFSTPHYDGHGAVLIRLADIAEDDLADLLEDGWRQKAPTTLVRRLDEA